MRDDGIVTELPTKIQVPLPAAATQVSAGYYGACAVLADGRIACWGEASALEHLGFGTKPRVYDLCDGAQ